jgi:hypothetical protein
VLARRRGRHVVPLSRLVSARGPTADTDDDRRRKVLCSR